MVNTDRVKSIATVPTVLSRYGYGTDKRRIPCPLHGGRNPNFSFDDHVWHCFRCGRHGDAIQFAMDLFGLSFPDALAKLSTGFGIAEVAPLMPAQREYEYWRGFVKAMNAYSKARNDAFATALLLAAGDESERECRGGAEKQ
jgi:DNA primase